MFSHIFLGVNDFERAFEFYTPLMRALGFKLRFCQKERPWAGWQPQNEARPLFLIGLPFDGCSAQAGNGQMVAFTAENRPLVDSIFAQVMAAGAMPGGLPGVRPQYHEHYYGAYFRDLDGNKLCVVCHEPPVLTESK